jgi:hypothetical protein
MRLLATFLALLPLTLAHASSDEPPRIEDGDFALPVAVDGAEVRLASRALIERASAPDVHVSGLAQAVFPDWSFLVTVATQTLNLAAASDEELGEFVSGAERGVHDLCSGAHARGDAPGSRWSVISIGGAPALRVRIDCDTKGPNGIDFVLNYVLIQPGREVLVSFMGNREHAAEIERAAQHMLDGARIHRYRARLFGKPRAYQMGYRVGRVLGVLLMLGLLAFVVLRVVRKR